MHYVLHQLLSPERSDCGYTLGRRDMNFLLRKKTRLDEQNFIYRLIFNFYCSFNFVIVLIYMYAMFYSCLDRIE